MKQSEIIAKVRDILNEHGSADVLSIGEDRVVLDEYIKSAIPDAVTMLGAKGYRVNVKNWVRQIDGKLPMADVVSLLCLKLDTWNRAISTITKVGTPEYAVAMNGYTAPGPNRPMCYREGDWIIPLPPGATVAIGEYNAAYDGTEINADDDTATAVCYMVAALAMGMFGDDAAKQRLSDISTNILV